MSSDSDFSRRLIDGYVLIDNDNGDTDDVERVFARHLWDTRRYFIGWSPPLFLCCI